MVLRSYHGDASSLKEVLIGIEVFNRTPGYNPKTDPIVRTEARRLRSKLDEYYENADGGYLVRISIPKGAYAASFELPRAPSGRENTFASGTDQLRVAAIVEQPPAAAQTRRPRSKRNMALVVVSGAIVVAVSCVAVWRLVPLWPARETNFSPVVRNLTSSPGDEESPSFSPDGSEVVFSWNGENQQSSSDLYVMLTSGGPIRRLTSDRGPDVHPVWSPDGTKIAFVRGWRDLMLISPLGNSEHKIAETSYYFVSWAPDSNTLAISTHDRPDQPFSMFTYSESSGEKRQITYPPGNSVGDIFPAFSPDGRSLASVRCMHDTCDIYVTPAGGGISRKITNQRGWIRGVAWTPDSRELIFASDRAGFSNLWRISALSPASPVQVPGTGDDEAYPAIGRSPKGGYRLAYEHRTFDTNLWTVSVSDDHGSGFGRTSTAKPLIFSTRIDSSPQLSPDGSQLAFVSNRNGRLEIWKSNADGTDEVQLTFLDSEEVGSPRWSPDGQRIVFDALSEAGRDIYSIDQTGGPVRRLTFTGEQERPSYSRDGQWIYFYSNHSGRNGIWKMRADAAGSPAELIAVQGTDEGHNPVESLDGQRLYFVRDHDLMSVPRSGGVATRVLHASVDDGWWDLSEKGIYFVDIEAGSLPGLAAPAANKAINFYSFRTHRVRTLAEIKKPVFFARPDFCVSRDGRRIIYGQADLSNTDIRIIDNFR